LSSFADCSDCPTIGPDGECCRCIGQALVKDQFHDHIDQKHTVTESETQNKPATETVSPSVAEAAESSDEIVQNETQNTSTSDSTVRKYPKRNKPLNDYVLEDDSVNVTVHYCYRMYDVPNTYNEAISSSESRYWKRAMSEEMNSLLNNDTFEVCRLPEGRNVIGGRWVYAVKLGPNGDEQYQARYVAKGYSQVQDIDYSETFSPTVRITSVRMLMQLAVQQGMIVHQMDVKTAYLNAPVDCELYIEQPEGFVADDKTDSNLVLKLKKSLYSLKQSGRNWNNMLYDYLISENFEQSLTDHCVYTRFNMDSSVVILF